ncbi:MAG: hypothetical protein ACR2PG_11760 [Hyphomicrobiaceae bacterium]
MIESKKSSSTTATTTTTGTRFIALDVAQDDKVLGTDQGWLGGFTHGIKVFGPWRHSSLKSNGCGGLVYLLKKKAGHHEMEIDGRKTGDVIKLKSFGYNLHTFLGDTIDFHLAWVSNLSTRRGHGVRCDILFDDLHYPPHNVHALKVEFPIEAGKVEPITRTVAINCRLRKAIENGAYRLKLRHHGITAYG